MRNPLIAATLGLCVTATGCLPLTASLGNDVSPGGERPSVFDDRDWATVLRENVKDRLVDYGHLMAHTEPLENYLRMIADLGPQSTPELFQAADSKAAFYINAYNAGILKAVVIEKGPATMYPPGLSGPDYRYHLRVDRKLMTLSDVRAAARAAVQGDARIEFALSAAAMGAPALSDQPWRADTLTRQLEDAARLAMDDKRMVLVDHEKQHLMVGLPIHEQRDALLAYCTKLTGAASPTLLNALLMMAGSVRREWLNTAVGYPEGVIPFDRALNAWKSG